jgi:hypothetical protein
MKAPRSKRWIGFFVVHSVLTLTAIVVPIVYHLSIQLRPEQLADAQRRWQENAPADYDLEYLVKRDGEDSETRETRYLVQVRAGLVVLIMEGDEVIYLEPALAAVAGSGTLALSAVDPRDYGVPALLAQIEAGMRQADTAARRDFVKADFDPNDGHPYHFIHRVRGTKQRVEWFVKLTHSPTNPRR